MIVGSLNYRISLGSGIAHTTILILILIGIGTPNSGVSAFTTKTTHRPKAVLSFHKQHEKISLKWHPQAAASSRSSTSRSRLFMSDVPQDDDDLQKKKKKAMRRRPPRLTREEENKDYWWKLPPPPEDQFVLIGDLLSLAVYGISDHLVCQIMSHQLVPTSSREIYTDMVANADAALHAPVWWDAASPQATAVLQTTLESHLVTQYSPLLEPMGQATTLLAAAWLLAGWFHRAFLFQNTLDCPTEKALEVTARTWLTTCAILLSLVVASQAVMGMEDWATNFQRGDVDYIVDSLTVLIVWRFMASYLMGGGSK